MRKKTDNVAKKSHTFKGYFERTAETQWNVVSTLTANTVSLNFKSINSFVNAHLISSQPLKLGGRRGTIDDIETIPFHPSCLPLPPGNLHSLMLSSHIFCLSLLLAHFTVPCRIVFAIPEDLEMWPYHLSFRFFTMVRRSSCTPAAFWILNVSLVTWSL